MTLQVLAAVEVDQPVIERLSASALESFLQALAADDLTLTDVE